MNTYIGTYVNIHLHIVRLDENYDISRRLFSEKLIEIFKI